MKTRYAKALALCLALRATDLPTQEAILASSGNPDRIEAAAVAVASSNDPAAIAVLARHFTERSFLRRLDTGRGSETSVVHLDRVFEALAEHPSQATESLCLSVAGNPEFNNVPARLNSLLSALAAVRPMSEPSANLFRTTSRSDYLEVNGPLLARNASPRALQVLGELLADETLNVAQRVSVAHWGLLPARTDLGVAAMCARLVENRGLSHEVLLAILESLYDYQARRWFGVRARQPSPPAWSSAPAAARDILTSMGTRMLGRPDLPPELRAAIQSTLEQLH